MLAMYRYTQSPKFLSKLNDYGNIIDGKALNNFFKDLSNSPRKAKKAHSLHKPFSKFNIWSAHLKSKGGAFFTVLYLICDGGINNCSGGGELCKSFISKCEKPTQQIVFLQIEQGEPYNKLSRFFT